MKGIIELQTECINCSLGNPGHRYVCDCGHSHDEHLLFMGCKAEDCTCLKYSQVLQRKSAGDVIADAVGL